jgi:glycosyltransferase involved in cell wall biosynthesis
LTNEPITFSVVIPVYNRPTLIRRAVASCLKQRHPAFEVVVVDDGSTDSTVGVVSSITDARLRLVVQPTNRGVGTARNLGADSARGEWIVWLDSDDELTADALESMEGEIGRAGDDVDAFRFMCRLDSGALSPGRPLGRDVWDYEGYVRWLNPVGNDGLKETLLCVRRRTFAHVRCPDSRHGGTLYHLDFSVRFKTATSPVVVRLYHSDAAAQVTRPSVQSAIAAAPDNAHEIEAILDRHGAALTRWAPGAAFMYQRGLVTQYFLSGNRMQGIRATLRLARSSGRSLSIWVVFALGILNRRALALVSTLRARRFLESWGLVANHRTPLR